MEYSRESQDRMKKIQELKDAGIIPYANNFRGKQDIDFIREQKDSIKEVDILMEHGAVGEFKTAGRIMLSRGMGKLLFMTIRDHKGDIQVCFMKDKVEFNTGRPTKNPPAFSIPLVKGDKNDYEKVESRDVSLKHLYEVVSEIELAGENKSAFKIAEKFCQVGDYIGIIGDLFVTKHGELTLLVKEFQILSKAVRPLPEKFHGVTDQETIYRQRYLDLISNEESYERMLFRSKYIQATRNFYLKNNFIEIDTPVLGSAASGAAAKPFITHHNDFGEEMFLRIAPEIALKMATVGRFERVFEFAKNFRNEGSDPSHMQEFYVVEHYAAWWNFEDNIKFTEEMFDYLFNELNLNKTVPIKDKEGNIKQVNFSTPWRRIDYVEGVKEACGIDVSKYFSGDEEKLIADIKSVGVEFEGMEQMVVPTLIDYLYKKVLRPSITGPAFVYNYPKTMQPLARQNDANPNIVEQFQVVVNGWEIIKAYSELVDPKIQTENFENQAEAQAKGDEEATQGDDAFVLAMEYGMPCQSGWAIGFDRILSLLTGQDNLRDVVLFPLMKSEKKEKKIETNLAVALINKEANLEAWQEMNTIAHLNAAYGAREGKNLFLFDAAKTEDGVDVTMNTTHAIMIKESHSNDELKNLIKEARGQKMLVTEFTREMIQTSDDAKITKIYKEKSFKDIEYLGILVYGNMKEVKKLTEKFELYSGNSPKKQEEKINTFTEVPNKEVILEMLEKYATGTKQHLLQVGAIMEYFAEKLGEDRHYWWTVGVLHDIDWDYIEKDGNKHCKEEFIKICNEFKIPESIIKDVQSHLYGLDRGLGVKPDTLVRKYLSAIDELSGFVWAYFRMIPSESTLDIKASSIKKKLKDKGFAAGVDRGEVINCETLLEIDLESFVEDIKVALSKGTWVK